LALLVGLGLGFLLLLALGGTLGASVLLFGCGSGGCIVVFGFVGCGKGRHGCCQSCDGEYADQSAFHESFSSSDFEFMKASCDDLAMYTMQNENEERLFRGAGGEYFFKSGNKNTI